MEVICAWCKATLGHKEGPEDEVSHGICKRCTSLVKQETSLVNAAGKLVEEASR